MNLVSRCWLLVAGCWLLVAGCWLLVPIREKQQGTSNKEPGTF